mgnify:CR=1 FL=1
MRLLPNIQDLVFTETRIDHRCEFQIAVILVVWDYDTKQHQQLLYQTRVPMEEIQAAPNINTKANLMAKVREDLVFSLLNHLLSHLDLPPRLAARHAEQLIRRCVQMAPDYQREHSASTPGDKLIYRGVDITQNVKGPVGFFRDCFLSEKPPGVRQDFPADSGPPVFQGNPFPRKAPPEIRRLTPSEYDEYINSLKVQDPETEE